MLRGYRVLELAGVLAGPSAGMFLAELGAEVIKIENARTGGDITRQWKLPSEDRSSTVSAYFCSANWGKTHLILDLKNESDRRQVYAIAEKADIVITNFKHGDEVKLGMEYDRLAGLKKDIIYAAISAFGDDDPRPGYDLVLQAETGFMHMNGTPESGPVKLPLAMVDLLAAHQLKEAILLALLQREKTGKGAYISCSLFKSALTALTNQATNWLMAGYSAGRAGSLHPNIAPYGESVSASDGRQIVLAIGTDDQFRKLCRILGEETLADDARFSANSGRVINRRELLQQMNRLASKQTSGSLLERLMREGVPAGMVKDIPRVMEDPAAQEMIIEETVDGVVTKRLSSIGFSIRES